MVKRIALAAVLVLTSSAASAETKYLYTDGAWSTFYIPVNTSGNQMCGMVVRGSRSSFYVKYSAKGRMFLSMWHSDWRIPDKTKVYPYIQFDNAIFPVEDGLGGTQKEKSYIDFNIPDGKELEFFQQFAGARKMYIGFRTGTETPYVVNMNGSRNNAKIFLTCAVEIDKRMGRQPFDQNQSRPAQPQVKQPFDLNAPKPVPTVPVKPKVDDGSI